MCEDTEQSWFQDFIRERLQPVTRAQWLGLLPTPKCSKLSRHPQRSTTETVIEWEIQYQGKLNEQLIGVTVEEQQEAEIEEADLVGEHIILVFVTGEEKSETITVQLRNIVVTMKLESA